MTNNLAQFFGIQSSLGRYRHALQSIYEKFQPSHCFIGKFTDDEQIKTVLHLADGQEADNFLYSLVGTPCAEAKQSLGTCCYNAGIQAKFPNDAALKAWQIESYIAVTIRSFDDKPVGILVCLFEQETAITKSEQAWFREIGYLIGAEFKYELNESKNRHLISQLSLGEALAKLCTIEWCLSSDIINASDYAYTLFGITDDQPLTRAQLLALVDPRKRQQLTKYLDAIAQEQLEHFDFTTQITTPAGITKHLSVLGVTKQDTLTDEVIVQLSIQDISEQQQLNQRMMLASTALEKASEAVMISDSENKIIWVNQALEHLTGYSEAELLGQDPVIFSSGQQDKQFYQNMWQCLNEYGVWCGEIYNQRKNGEIYPEELLLNVVKDEHGHVTNYVALFRDISDWKETERRLTFYANKEPLTGLANRRAFIECVDNHVQFGDKFSVPFVVLSIDINRFKEINDIYGYDMGDKLLVAVAQRLTTVIDNDDFVCRYGSNEFTVLLPEHDIRSAKAIAEQIQQVLTAPFNFDKVSLDIIASIGVAQYPDSGTNATDLLRNANHAMMRVKGSDKREVGIHDFQLQNQYLRRLSLRDKLKTALDEKLLTVHYQPIICAQTQQIEKFEALVRWHDSLFGFVSPGEFIPIAEEFGLISAIGQFVLERACQDLKQIHDLGYSHISVSINRSINEFRTDNDQVQLVTQAIADSGVPADKVVIEITESVAMSSNHYVDEALAQLKRQGIKIALDDFCTGFSSLTNLIEYPVDILKIDKSFVDQVLINDHHSLLTQTLVGLASKLDMQVIAEGVETIEQLSCLKDYGCNQIQGYYFSPALALSDCLSLLEHKQLSA